MTDRNKVQQLSPVDIPMMRHHICELQDAKERGAPGDVIDRAAELGLLVGRIGPALLDAVERLPLPESEDHD